MLTPLDIENKEFKKGIRGYKEDEVDDFLDRIKEDYENLYKENIELKDKISMLSDQISRYKNIEETLKNTLIIAQNTAEEVGQNATKKAELIVEEAENKRKLIIESANNEVVNIKRDYEEVRKEFKLFRGKFLDLLEDQLKNIQENFSEIE